MQYGYFDEQAREYVITRPDTPQPWANYLGSPEYGALISNNAGGYSFVRSGANGRILRYVFNAFDRPGRYIYLRDNESEMCIRDSPFSFCRQTQNAPSRRPARAAALPAPPLLCYL